MAQFCNSGWLSIPLTFTVGTTLNGTNDATLIEHWDGTKWRIIPSLNPGTTLNQLLAVTATTSTDAWAVGNSTYQTGSNAEPLIEHWDGTGWNVVPSPAAGSYNILTDVDALSSNDVWAVGYFSNSNTPSQTLIEHWDGGSWSIISSPNPKTYDFLEGITALSSSDVWAVGSSADNNGRKTLIEHWDGTNWQVIPSPNPDRKANELLKITSVPGSNQLWAVGDYGHRGTWALTEHWDGMSWNIVSSPKPMPARGSYLQGITALSSDNIWAVGFYIMGHSRTLLEHWDGTQWTVVTNNPLHLYLHSVTQVPGTSQVWMVGQYQDLKTTITGSLIEFYC